MGKPANITDLAYVKKWLDEDDALRGFRGYVYVASPYSQYYAGPLAAYSEAITIAARVMEADIPCFVPILHSHPPSLQMEPDPKLLTHAFWVDTIDMPLLTQSSLLLVTGLDGWRDSTGIRMEIDKANEISLPIAYLDPNTLEVAW